ncbi:transporter substrate-binding domain-containing protein [Alkalimarinus alittae]|uniref:Transporter substrate-binding domain-containing protein n=1 Tax=Alkalimarinus alittae TaxID=2961619 RepID=A0ABY6N3K8_9ALTE|nr:transporter substrate-binding domain-containing protein [Alkalimarinus alittae]UZE96701.1 transporter substrate-binding domain-containing protein [Alkalimarinus alittae]
MSKILIRLSFILLLISNKLAYADVNQYVCGISDGFPPYQFKSAQGDVDGFDADVLKLISNSESNQFSFYQANWDSVVSDLVHTRKLDCAVGMEITEVRARYFDFTVPYYYRYTVVFVLSTNTHIKSLTDLMGRKVAGDRHSELEKSLELKGVGNLIRLRQTGSKEESMRLLKSGEVVAVIAPKEVGIYLAKALNMDVNIIDVFEQRSPVGMAVKKGNAETLNVLNKALKKLIKNGEIEKLHQQWFD